jgi:hypothetical protein
MIAKCEPGSVPSVLSYRRTQETHAKKEEEEEGEREKEEEEDEEEEEEEREGGGGGRSSSHKSIDMTEAQSIDMRSQHRSAADATAVDPWVQNRLPGMADPTTSTTGSKET